MSLVVGVDACRQGWLFLLLDGDAFADAKCHASLEAGLREHAAASVVGIDMPLGLAANGLRTADVEGRKLLGRRASTLFVTPPRAAIEADSYAEANARSRALGTGGVSQQAFALAPKIRELDGVAAGDRRLVEVHPELAFREMAGEPLAEGKHSWAGHARRLRLLEERGIRIPIDLGLAGRVAPDDVLDAAAVAWTAARFQRGEAVSIPSPPQEIEGRSVAIWY